MRRYDSKYTNFPYLNIDEYFEFPSLEESSEGIVCVGGNLSPGMLVSAYLQGIFPWYSKDEPILKEIIKSSGLPVKWNEKEEP